jgi:membrane-associated protease RseP (regulator of RpoE activity)
MNKETNHINAPEVSTHQDNGWKWAAIAVGALLLVSVVCLIGCLIGGIVGVSMFSIRSSSSGRMPHAPEPDSMPMPEPWQDPMPPHGPEHGEPMNPMGTQAWLGVTYTMVEGGAQIIEVTPNSPSERANLRVGDVVVAVEGRRVNAQRDLRDHILRYAPGDRVELTLLRNGRKQSVSVRLGTRPPDTMQQPQFPFED